MDVLVTYDVDTTDASGETRLTRVAHACERHGVRVQKSVFECRLTPARLERLIVELHNLIEPRSDSVHIYRFEGTLKAARMSLGRTVSREPGDPWIL